jgi:YidC/Oxa1 family membrane protein insertase
MMEKRALIAILLSVLILVIYQWLFVKPQKAPEQVTEEKAKVPIEKSEKQPEPIEKKQVQKKQEDAETSETVNEFIEDKIQDGQEKLISIETDLYSIKFTNKGARIRSWELKNYQDDEGRPLELVSRKMAWKGQLPLSIFVPNNEKVSNKINSALFVANKRELKITKQNRKEILIFRYNDGKGLNITKSFNFFFDSYLIDIKVRTSSEELSNYGFILLGPDIGNQPYAKKRSLFSAPQAMIQSIISINGKMERVKSLKREESQEAVLSKIFQGSIKVIGVEDNYFTAFFLTAEAIDQGIVVQRTIEIGKDEDKATYRDALQSGLPLNVKGKNVNLFVGPKDYELLSEISPELEGVVNFGVFSFIAKPLLFVLQAINKYVKNYGFSIIILTILIKMLFHPLTRKSYKSMKKMQTLQPKLNAIRDKYKKAKKDPVLRQKMNQEIMELYRKEGVSPMGGCLPMLLQLPVLFAIYKILYVSIELRHAPFIWWITDLAKKDPYYITPIIMGITMLIQQRSTPTTGDPAQTRMLKLMPIFFTFLFLNFPSGLVLYWLVNNLITIGEQRLININAKKEPKKVKGKSKAKSKKKKRGD